MKRETRIVLFALASLALITSCSSKSARSASDQTDKLQSVTSDRVHLSNLATVMINDAREARSRIANKQQEAAVDRVNDALRQWNEIQSKAKGQRYVPIYQEVETVSVWQPHAVIENGKVTAVTQDQSRNRSAEPKAAVAGTSGAVTTISADVQAIRDHLKAAQSALQNNKLDEATAALDAVQKAVVATSVAGDLPLIRARQNLILARTRADANDWTGAHAALNQASAALEEYANLQNNSHTSDARRVRGEIDSLASNVEQKHSDVGNKIRSWWEDTSEWIISPNPQSSQSAQR